MLVFYDAAGRPSWQPSPKALRHGFASLAAYPEWLVMLFSVTVAGHPCKVLLDNSTSTNVISQALAQRLHLDVEASDAHITVSTGITGISYRLLLSSRSALKAGLPSWHLLMG